LDGCAPKAFGRLFSGVCFWFRLFFRDFLVVVVALQQSFPTWSCSKKKQVLEAIGMLKNSWL
jgi:hypothetical protein